MVGKKALKKYYESYFTTEDSSPIDFPYSISTNYAQTVLRKQLKDLFVDLIKNMKGKIKVLDFGCGDGSTIFGLNRLLGNINIQFYGLDVSKEAVTRNTKMANMQGINNCNFICNDAESTKLKEKFDIIISSEVIEHVPNPGKYIKKANSLLKEGGILIISTPNGGNYLKKAYSLMPSFIKNVFIHRQKETPHFNEHISVQSYSQLKNTLKEHGFNIVKKSRGSLLWGNNCIDKYKILFFLLSFLELIVPKCCVNMSWDMMLICKKEKEC